jgi:hypothetical protein
MKANYEMIFYGKNMNPSNPFPWAKLILIDEPIPTHSMNYTCADLSKRNDVNFFIDVN